MITKNKLKNFNKVYVIVYSSKQKFNNGKASQRIIVYDTTPEEVFKVVEQSLNK